MKLLSFLMSMVLLFSSCGTIVSGQTRAITTQHPSNKSKKVQVAILLDTSNSMDGLIDQAKSTLWNILSTISTLKYDGESPIFEFSLYQYGNDGLSATGNFIKQEIEFTTNMDDISEHLFALRTNGGTEMCGAVIDEAVAHLEWGKDQSDLKMIYIAGNEPFNQGAIQYPESISKAREKNIVVNTIFCGDEKTGISNLWQDAAIKGNGKYLFINSNEKVMTISTPYDDEIAILNNKLNNTYHGYGKDGVTFKEKQIKQDENANSVSKANYTDRVITKSKAQVYSNKKWDLVDKYKNNLDSIKYLKDTELPSELKGKTEEDKKVFVVEQTKERETIQKKITELSVQRESYIKSNQKTPSGSSFGDAVNEAIKEQSKNAGYKIN